MIKVDNLHKHFGGFHAVDGATLEIERGTITGLIGPNGAGKTTTFYIIAGLMNPDDGEIKLSNQDISKLPMHKRSKLGIKYLPQEPSIFQNLTVYENLLGLAELSFKNKKDITDFVSSSIEEFSLSDIMQLKGRQLSGGQRRKVEIARTLAADPKIILLDEPFAALDILTIKMLQEIIVNLQAIERITVVVCDHQARDLLSCVDRAIVLSNGKIIASGSPNEIINDSSARSAYFGDEFKIN